MPYRLEDTVELVKYHQTAEGIQMGSGICEEHANAVKFASNKIKEGVTNQKPEEVVLGSCQAVFESLAAMHAMGYDLNEFDSAFRTYVDFRFRNIRDWTEDKPDFKYDIPAECVFDISDDGEERSTTVK